MRGLFVGAGALLVICNTWAAPFSTASFDAACKAAAQSGKIVLVDFYTTWCGPCKLLDKNTWTDPAVIKLLESKTVSLRVDAEKETALADRYHIDVYPSVLLLKPDGKEIDRLVGYRDPKTFIADFTDSLNGKDSLTRAKESVAKAGADDPMARMKYGETLAEKGQDAQALAEFLWCFDHGLENGPEFTGVRLSFLLMELKQLGTHYPAATQALVTRRDARQAKLSAGSIDRQSAVDLVALNKILDQGDRNMAVFDKLPQGSPARAAVARMLVDQLLKAKRYQDVLVGMGDKAGFEQQLAEFKSFNAGQHGAAKAAFTEFVTSSGVDVFEALAGLNRDNDAREVAQQVFDFNSSNETRDQLAKAATRAGNNGLAVFANQELHSAKSTAAK